MPGIVGIISKRPAPECERLVKAMVGSMMHEPFYVSGMHSASEMGVYGGWVAHRESFAAGQVFTDDRRDISLLFSGECLADSETKTVANHGAGAEAVRQSHWLIRLYEKEGEQFFAKLNGLFSGLLIDKRRGKTFLFNDRYGVERVYWHEADDAFYFASEAKALLRVLPELRTFDEEGVAQFLTFGCTLEGRTLFHGIEFLPGATLWSFAGSEHRRQKYFSPQTWESQPILPSESFEAEFQETFKRILPRHFESESGIGISLTAGLDSRMIMACLPRTKTKPVCYTFEGPRGITLDAAIAGRIARACDLEHRVLRIGPDFFSNFPSLADRTVSITDGCLGVLGTHEIYLNGPARQWAPVRMTGNYGSEIFRGVSTFKPLRLSPQLTNRNSNRLPSRGVNEALGIDGDAVSFAAFQEIPWRRFGVLAAGRSQSTFRTPFLDNQMVALAYRAPENLRTSSGPALRLIRGGNPALAEISTDMGELGLSGFSGTAKRLFAQATFKADYLFNEGLPHWMSPLDSLFGSLGFRAGVLGLHKPLHYRSWFRHELLDYVRYVLSDAQTRRSSLWSSDFLETMARDHARGRKNYVREIDAVLTLEAVDRLLLHSPSGSFALPARDCVSPADCALLK